MGLRSLDASMDKSLKPLRLVGFSVAKYPVKSASMGEQQPIGLGYQDPVLSL